jgi:hypothetical protein
MLAQRDRRRWLMGFRKPKALRASSLISRLTPSLAALVMPVRMNASICGHHAWMVLARRCSSGVSVSAHHW